MSTFVLQYHLEGSPEKFTLPLEPGQITIGRLDDNTLTIKDPRMSRHHASIQVSEHTVFILDHNASNGVLIDRLRIPPNQWTLLPPGSTAILGPLIISIIPAASASAVQPGRPPQPPASVQPVTPPVQATPKAPPAIPPSQPAAAPAAPAPAFQAALRPVPPSPQAPPAIPPSQPSAAPAAPASAFQAARRPAPSSPQPPPAIPPSRRSINLPLLIILSVIILCLCIVTIGAIIWLQFPGLLTNLDTEVIPIPIAISSPTPGEESFSSEPPSVQAAHSLRASEGTFQDEHGVSMVLPPGSVPLTETLTIETATLSSVMQRELEQAYTVESLAYSVAAGSVDGVGRATMSLPAPSPASRIAVLVDDRFMAILPIVPQNGNLEFTPFLGAPGAAVSYPTLAQATIPNRYFVITPKEEASGSFRSLAGQYALAQEPDLISCIPNIWRGNHCWMNRAGSVVVLFWNTEIPDEMTASDPLRPPEVIDGMVRNITSIMSTYVQAGFPAAAISSSDPVYVVISASETEPNYSQKTGNVYLGWNVVSEIAAGGGKCTLAHELFHWIEDEEYAMNGAALINDRSWWLEMSAENGSYLVDSTCISRSLQTYGYAESGDRLAWQVEPFLWASKEGARYIQALQMYISICDGARCFISPSEFNTLINAGDYPSSATREAYYRNADDLGRYLLGYPPLLSRSGAFIPDALKKGLGYGDFIWIKAVPETKIETTTTGRITTKDYTANVNTTISHGGVYPLYVSNGKGSPGGGKDGYTGLPAMLVVSSGTPLWYTLDNGMPQFHDGSGELKLGALSDKLGTGLLRIVATAPDGDKTFQAEVKPVDLSGDWIHQFSNVQRTIIDCEMENEEPLEAIDFVSLLSGYGTFVPDPAVPDGSRYIWQGSIPDSQGATIEAEIVVEVDKITLTYLIDVPKPSPSSAMLTYVGGSVHHPNALVDTPDWFAWLNAAALLALGGLVLALPAMCQKIAPRLGRVTPLALAMLAATILLSGCFGMAIWGTFSGTYTFTSLKLPDLEKLPAESAELGELTWMLEGKGEVNYDLHLLVQIEDAEGNISEEESVCAMMFTGDLKGLIGPADMVPQPNNE